MGTKSVMLGTKEVPGAIHAALLAVRNWLGQQGGGLSALVQAGDIRIGPDVHVAVSVSASGDSPGEEASSAHDVIHEGMPGSITISAEIIGQLIDARVKAAESGVAGGESLLALAPNAKREDRIQAERLDALNEGRFEGLSEALYIIGVIKEFAPVAEAPDA